MTSQNMVVFILVLTCLMGCASCSTRTVYIPVETTADTTVYEQAVIHIVEKDSASIEALIQCNEEGKAYIAELNRLKGKNLNLTLQLDSLGRLYAQAESEEDTLQMKQETKVITVHEPQPYPVEVPVEVPTEISTLNKFFITTGKIGLIALILIIAIFLIKRKR